MQLHHPKDAIQRQPRSLGRAVLARSDGRLRELYQQGCMKILLPRFGDEAVLVNTSGGLTGGDRLSLEVRLGQAEAVTMTTQAAERVYRAAEGVARLDQRLNLGAQSRLHWLPQETILFNGAALERRLTVEMDETAQFLGLETYVFGRAAHGEILDRLHLRDNWRIRRAGRLLHAEALRLDRMPQGAASLSGIGAAAMLLLVAPEAEARLAHCRTLLPAPQTAGVEAGVTSPAPGLLLLRLLAPAAHHLRQALLPLLSFLRGAPPPRVWQY